MTAEEITTRLSEPFEAREVKWKPAVVSGNRALALAYVDARVIQDRLDEVLGVVGWQDEYTLLPEGTVKCRLRVRIDGEWIAKEDVGGQSEQPDEGDKMKAAFSDALKRAAVKFGVGRYLYRLPQQWCDYDPQKRQFVRLPTLPANSVKAASAPKPSMVPEVKAWVSFLGTSPTIEQLNESCRKELPGIKEKAGLAVRQQIWALIENYARNHEWAYDTESKAFLAPQEAA